MGKIGDQFHILPVSSSMCHMSVSAGWVRLMMKQAALETSPSGICGARLSFETELNLVQRNPHNWWWCVCVFVHAHAFVLITIIICMILYLCHLLSTISRYRRNPPSLLLIEAIQILSNGFSSEGFSIKLTQMPTEAVIYISATLHTLCDQYVV